MLEETFSLIKKFEPLRKFPSRNKIGLLRTGYDLLKEDISAIIRFLEQENLPINPDLISLIHQIGIVTFKRSKLKKALESGNSEEVKSFFMSWSKVDGVSDPELYERRKEELLYLRLKE